MTHDLWATLNVKMFDYLSSVTLADLVAQQGGKSGGDVAVMHQERRTADERRKGERQRAKLIAVGS